MNKFVKYLKQLKTGNNSNLLETIETAFKLIFEAPSSDDANKPPQTVGTTGPPANAISFNPNDKADYFKQTLPNNKLKQVIKAQSFGNGVKYYPIAGKGAITLDPLKSGQGRNDNANISSGEWAGDSGGYNLGGPAN